MAVWDRVPLVPVIVTVNVPVVVELHDSVEVPDVPRVTLVGLRVQVRPVGETVEVSVTVPVNPFTLVTVMVEVAVAPTVVETLVGLAVTVKSRTVKATVADAELVPLVPVTVTV